MKCFGDKSRCLHCKIILLDDQELFHEVMEMTTGQDILEKVFQHLNLIETAYFGLRYLDSTNQTHWLEPTKRIMKQMKGSTPYTLYFSVKFYAADPSKLAEEITRYQLFLQVKQDILQGRLPVPHDLAAELGAYAVQSELGDFDPERHPSGYISEFRFVANQSTILETDIADKHKQLLGMVPSDAEAKYLEKVMWQDMYGVDLHPVLGEDNIEYFLGLTPAGVVVLRNKARAGNYFWPRITKVYFRGKFFMLRVRDKNNSEKTYGFETPSKSACKHLWRCCVEHHAFFRLTQSAATSPQALFSLHCNYSGRTEKEALLDAQNYARPQPQFTRQPSRKFQRRILGNGLNSSLVDCGTSSTTLTSIHPLGSGSATSLPACHSYSNGSSIPQLYRNGSEGALPSTNGTNNNHNNNNNNNNNNSNKTDLNESRTNGTISPSSLILTSIEDEENMKMSRRASSADSQSSADSKGHRRRRRRSRHRSSDCDSEGSTGSKSRHRRHHHRSRHSSGESCDKHRHRRHRHRNNSRSSAGSTGEAELHWGHLRPGESPGQAATVKDLCRNGYTPSGHDTESDFTHTSRRRHRKHRSRSRSPSESKRCLPDELKPHISLKLQGTDGLTHAELKDIPYTRIETAKNIKIKYPTSKAKKHKNNRKNKGLPTDLEDQVPASTESPPPPYTPQGHQNHYKWRDSDKSGSSPDDVKKEIPDVIQSNKASGKGQSNSSPRTIVTDSSHTNGHDVSTKRHEHPPRITSPIPPPPPSHHHMQRAIIDRGQYSAPSEETYYHEKRNHYQHEGGQYNGGNTLNHYQHRGGHRGDPNSDVTTSIKPDLPSPQSSETSGISVGSSSVSMLPSATVVTSQNSEEPPVSYSNYTSFNFRTQQPFPASIDDHRELKQPNSLTIIPSALSSNIINNRNSANYGIISCKNNSSPSNSKSFYSQSNENGQRFFTLPKCSTNSQRSTNNCSPGQTQVQGQSNRSEQPLLQRTSMHHEINNKLSDRYLINVQNGSLTENIDLVNSRSETIEEESSSKDSVCSKPDSLRPMPHPRNSRLSPSSNDPDYANSFMVKTMKRMDNKYRHSPSSVTSVNTIGIPPSSPSVWSAHNSIPDSGDELTEGSKHTRFDDSYKEQYFVSPKPIAIRPFFSNSQNINTLSESSYNSRCESLPPVGTTLRSYNNTPREGMSQSSTWCRGATTAKYQSTVELPEHRIIPVSNTATEGNRQNSNAHWKVYNWDTGRTNVPNSSKPPIPNPEQLSHIGQRTADLTRRGRRGSAGSLEMILGPLIQSALQHQQR